MSDWRNEYRRALLEYVARWGDVRDWGDCVPVTGAAFVSHFQTCPLDPDACGDPEEASRERYWDDSLSEGPAEMQYGVEVAVACFCGQYNGVHVRIDQPVTQIILGLLSKER